MTVKSFLRSLANYCLGPLDLTLERKSVLEYRISSLSNRYVLTPTLFERALAGKKAPVTIDVGASVGNTVRRVLETCPDATVFAFEPQPELFKQMQERYRDNEKVHIYTCGVGASSGRMQLHISERAQASSFLPASNFGLRAVPFAAEKAVSEIEVVTLDEWHSNLEEPPTTIDLIKVDTQGFEKYVIAGGQQVFQKTAFVIMEAAFRAVYEGQAVYEELILLMENMGFSVKAVEAGYVNRDSGELVEVNVLFEKGAER